MPHFQLETEMGADTDTHILLTYHRAGTVNQTLIRLAVLPHVAKQKRLPSHRLYLPSCGSWVYLRTWLRLLGLEYLVTVTVYWVHFGTSKRLPRTGCTCRGQGWVSGFGSKFSGLEFRGLPMLTLKSGVRGSGFGV